MYKLSKVYPGGKQVIKDISLSFLPGAKIGVLGGNGAGKSTLLKIMAGIDKEYNGEAKLADGIKVGYLPQEPELNDCLNVYENVMEGMAEAKKLVDDLNLAEIPINMIDKRSKMSKTIDNIYLSTDPYIKVRSFYLQNRRSEIYSKKYIENKNNNMDAEFEKLLD